MESSAQLRFTGFTITMRFSATFTRCCAPVGGFTRNVGEVRTLRACGDACACFLETKSSQGGLVVSQSLGSSLTPHRQHQACGWLDLKTLAPESRKQRWWLVQKRNFEVTCEPSS